MVKLQVDTYNCHFTKKDSLAICVHSSGFYEITLNGFFKEHLWVTVFETFFLWFHQLFGRKDHVPHSETAVYKGSIERMVWKVSLSLHEITCAGLCLIIAQVFKPRRATSWQDFIYTRFSSIEVRFKTSLPSKKAMRCVGLNHNDIFSSYEFDFVSNVWREPKISTF